MAVPVFVGAGAGVGILAGSGTVSKTDCSAGSLILIHFITRGTSLDWSAFSSVVNIEQIDGMPDDIEALTFTSQVGATGHHALFYGRATANGTCSANASVGASGEDLFLRMYEFSGASLGTTLATVLEGGEDFIGGNETAGTGTSVGNAELTTLGADRLACNFVALDNDLAIGNFTGETGGDWTEAVAEYTDATGATATLQLQTAAIASAGTIDGGAVTITSAGWGVLGTAIIPGPDIQPPGTRLRWAAAQRRGRR